MTDDSTDLADFEEYMNAWKETDRKRGIFTERDREYLLGKLDISGQDELNLLYRMRQRLRESLLDTNMLSRVPEDEIDKVVEEEYFPIGMIVGSLADFVYKLAVRTYDDASYSLANTLERRISYYYEDSKIVEDDIEIHYADINVNIDIEHNEMSLRSYLERVMYEEDSRSKISSVDIMVTRSLNFDDELVGVSLPNTDEIVGVHPVTATIIEDIQED